MICIFEWRDFNSTATRRALKKGVEEPVAWKVHTGEGFFFGRHSNFPGTFLFRFGKQETDELKLVFDSQ